MKGNPNNFITLANAADSKMSIPDFKLQRDTRAQKVSFCLRNKSIRWQELCLLAHSQQSDTFQNFRNKVFVIGIPRELGRSS